MRKDITLEQLHNKGFEHAKIILDTSDFSWWCQYVHGYSNEKFHKDIWKDMCDYFMDSYSYVTFTKFENPENKFEELMNDFIVSNPEFEGKVRLVFTN